MMRTQTGFDEPVFQEVRVPLQAHEIPVLLDLGGVVVHLRVEQTLEALGRLPGVTGESMIDFVHDFHSHGLSHEYECGRLTSRAFYERVREMTGMRATPEEFFSIWDRMIGDEVAGVRRFVHDLTTGEGADYNVYVLSNTNPSHMAHILARLPWLSQAVSGVFVSYRIGVKKPDHRIFQHVMGRLDVEAPSRVRFIDDSEANVVSASQLGIRSFRFLSADRLREEFFEKKQDASEQ